MNNNWPAVLLILRSFGAVLLCCVAIFAFLNDNSVRAVSDVDNKIATPTPVPRGNLRSRVARYSQFPHEVNAHRVNCGNCHKFPSDNWQKVREGKEAFPDITEYPKHESCLNCHKQQFFKGARPAICSICHTTPSPRDSTRHAFPNPREVFDTTSKGKTAVSDFAISFPHDKHVEIVSKTDARPEQFVNASWIRLSPRAEESCSVCHQTYKPQDKSDDEYVTKPPAKLGDGFWLKKGTFKTAPIEHTTCFTCHSVDSGILPAPTDCATCHKLKPPDVAVDFDPKLAETMGIDDKILLTSWRRRNFSGTFRHEWFSHAELSCSTCHNVMTMNTVAPRSSGVKIGACATCHVTPTSDEGGALNFEIDSRKANAKFECVKCHITFGISSIPESHLKTIATAK